MPTVSVIMPCYNMEKFIAHSIESVRNQSLTDWELLIVDDASTDKTADKVRPYCEQDERVKLTVKSRHSGIASSRNQALASAKGRYLAFLDADDIWHPEKLERQLAFMQEHEVAFSYSAYQLIDEEGKALQKTIATAGNLTHDAYLQNTIIGCSTVMLDKDKVGEVTIPDFRTSEDTATWLNILRKGFLAYAIEETLVSYRIRRKSASSNKLKASYDLWKVYRIQEKLPFFKALGYYGSYAFHAIKKRL